MKRFWLSYGLNLLLCLRLLQSMFKMWKMQMTGGLSFDAKGTLFGAATVQQPKPGESTWGNPTNEVLGFKKESGSFQFHCHFSNGNDDICCGELVLTNHCVLSGFCEIYNYILCSYVHLLLSIALMI